MNTPRKEQSYSWISRFAIEHIFSRDDLCRGDDFPHDLWKKMGEAGFFKIGIAPSYGGCGGGYKQLLEAGEVFVRSSYNMGLALSWLYQQLIAVYLISGFGTERQRKKYLRKLDQANLSESLFLWFYKQ